MYSMSDSTVFSLLVFIFIILKMCNFGLVWILIFIYPQLFLITREESDNLQLKMYHYSILHKIWYVSFQYDILLCGYIPFAYSLTFAIHHTHDHPSFQLTNQPSMHPWNPFIHIFLCISIHSSICHYGFFYDAGSTWST